jgi:hypothetical protein
MSQVLVVKFRCKVEDVLVGRPSDAASHLDGEVALIQLLMLRIDLAAFSCMGQQLSLMLWRVHIGGMLPFLPKEPKYSCY